MGSNKFAKPQPNQWNDDSTINGKDISVSTSSHIYYSDTPGFNINSTSFYEYTNVKALRYYLDLKNMFSGIIYGTPFQISDFAKWHSQTFLIANPLDTTIFILGDDEDQKLGDGWIDIPIGVPGS